ncbi:MAG TPA: class II aldolase/adducin family protein [Dongiaceae bacterium]|jgi:rhamnose utilization protein RhaD (predicted bifunctional aldolase and dehydrogenase)|nr:class II aldolase/adducin family protein [Dongiaceae bacterium]
MTPPAELQALRDVSARVGSDITLVQGAGGNTSLKQGGVLWVKASGAWLAEAGKRDIFVPVDLPGALRALKDGIEKMPVADPAAKLRPSIETSLHALLPHRVVLHVHAVNTIAWAACMGVESELALRLKGLAWARVPYRRPGLPLSQVVAEATARQKPDVLILGNHGLLVGAEDCATAEALVHEVERRLHLPARPAPGGDVAALAALCRGTDYRPAADEACHRLATDPRSLAIVTAGSLYPDHVVFLGPAMRAVAEGERIADILAVNTTANLPPPVALLVPGAGAIVRSDILLGAEAMLVCLALVAERLPAEAEISYLPADEELALLDWDAEKYRKSLAMKA